MLELNSCIYQDTCFLIIMKLNWWFWAGACPTSSRRTCRSGASPGWPFLSSSRCSSSKQHVLHEARESRTIWHNFSLVLVTTAWLKIVNSNLSLISFKLRKVFLLLITFFRKELVMFIYNLIYILYLFVWLALSYSDRRAAVCYIALHFLFCYIFRWIRYRVRTEAVTHLRLFKPWSYARVICFLYFGHSFTSQLAVFSPTLKKSRDL